MTDITQTDPTSVELARLRKALAIQIAYAAVTPIYAMSDKIIERIDDIEDEINELDKRKSFLKDELRGLTKGNDYGNFTGEINDAWDQFFNVIAPQVQWLTDADRLEMFWELLCGPAFTDARQGKVERLLNLPTELVKAVRNRSTSQADALHRLEFRHDYAKVHNLSGVLDVRFGRFPTQSAELPRKCFAVYFLLDDENQIVYIGQSHNVRGRMKEHWRTKRKDGIVSWVVIQVDSFKTMDDTETRLIYEYRPRLNIIGNPDRDPKMGGQS